MFTWDMPLILILMQGIEKKVLTVLVNLVFGILLCKHLVKSSPRTLLDIEHVFLVHSDQNVFTIPHNVKNKSSLSNPDSIPELKIATCSYSIFDPNKSAFTFLP